MIERAIQLANLDKYVNGLPNGLETRVGHNGVKLSGGQRQRLGIARAFLRDATLLILDEPTASLDADSEREIKKSISELKVGRISIVVAHRLSTIKGADKILFINNGTIIESGSHQDLLSKKGQYYNMYKESSQRET